MSTEHVLTTEEKLKALREATTAPMRDWRYYDISGGGELTAEQSLYEMIRTLIERDKDDLIGRVWTDHEEYVRWLVARYDPEIRYDDLPEVFATSVVYDRRYLRWPRKRHATIVVYRMVPWGEIEASNTDSNPDGAAGE